jgi:NAD(P)-dependent dehydrogenase (short-subunit alcohol dehydrogenase family)
VILGGTSGMGLATAKKLLDRGARVLVTGRSQAGLDSAKQELGTAALVVSSDARSLADIAGRGSPPFSTAPTAFRERLAAGGAMARLAVARTLALPADSVDIVYRAIY